MIEYESNEKIIALPHKPSDFTRKVKRTAQQTAESSTNADGKSKSSEDDKKGNNNNTRVIDHQHGVCLSHSAADRQQR